MRSRVAGHKVPRDEASGAVMNTTMRCLHSVVPDKSQATYGLHGISVASMFDSLLDTNALREKKYTGLS